MAKWLFKAFIQKTFSLLPFGERLNAAAQYVLSGGDRLNDTYFFGRLAHAANHRKYYHKYVSEQFPARCIEIGTGWYPVVPLAFYLWGGHQLFSCDNRAHMSLGGLAETVKKFRLKIAAGELDHLNFLPDRISTLNRWNAGNYKNLQDALLPFQLKYSSNGLTGLGLAAGQSEIIFSNNTLGNVKEEELYKLLLNARNLLKPGGIMSHFIDLTDQSSHFDNSIGPFNFLKFSKKQWRWLSNDLLFQNRLRLKNYMEVFQALDMPIIEQIIQNESEGAIFRQQLHADFSSYSTSELRISHAHLVSASYGTSASQTLN